MKNLSKKHMNLLFLKCIIKLKLSNHLNLLTLKHDVVTILEQHSLSSDIFVKYINCLTRQQITSIVDRAEKLISKYNYVTEHDIDLDLIDFKNIKPKINIKFIKQNVLNILYNLKETIQ